jgi:hypothetical protein
LRVKEDRSHGQEENADKEKGSHKEETSIEEESPGEEKKRDHIHWEGY